MKHSHLGFVDWGIGGLTVLSQVLKHEPRLRITYFSDAGFTPYGKLSAVDLTKRLHEIVGWLQIQGCDGVVIACNAASAALLQTKASFSIPVYDVITSAVIALKAMPYAEIGVIGGDATVQSHVYRDMLHKMNVQELSAQPLSGLIEEGRLTSTVIVPLLKNIFQGFDEKNIEALVLACTHYPAVAHHVAALCPNWQLIDPAEYVASALAPYLLASQSPSQAYYTTGSVEQTIASAEKAFAFHISEVVKISL